jgi:metal iron transporter
MSIPLPKGEATPSSLSSKSWLRILQLVNPFAKRQSASPDELTFANNLFVVALGWAIFAVVVIADIYAMVQLGRGEA